ncbi:Flp1 family type IVb pilin [Vallitaleaceae bacterium 9-2]
MNKLLVTTYVKGKLFMDRIIHDEEGMGMVELALIIIILIGLAIIFQKEIELFMTNIFEEFNIDELK